LHAFRWNGTDGLIDIETCPQLGDRAGVSSKGFLPPLVESFTDGFVRVIFGFVIFRDKDDNADTAGVRVGERKGFVESKLSVFGEGSRSFDCFHSFVFRIGGRKIVAKVWMVIWAADVTDIVLLSFNFNVTGKSKLIEDIYTMK
jgi:hypothetical protein